MRSIAEKLLLNGLVEGFDMCIFDALPTYISGSCSGKSKEGVEIPAQNPVSI
jgi:hypothetical protein